jgi:hypothetical protein
MAEMVGTDMMIVDIRRLQVEETSAKEKIFELTFELFCAS